MLKIGQMVENVQKRCFECHGFVRFGKINKITSSGGRFKIVDSSGHESCFGDEKDYKIMGGKSEEVE